MSCTPEKLHWPGSRDAVWVKLLESFREPDFEKRPGSSAISTVSSFFRPLVNVFLILSFSLSGFSSLAIIPGRADRRYKLERGVTATVVHVIITASEVTRNDSKSDQALSFTSCSPLVR